MRRFDEADTMGALISMTMEQAVGDVQLQRALTEQLAGGGAAEPLVVECRAPADVRVARADVRQLRENPDSDAGPIVARQLGERFVAMHGVAADAHLAVDTRAPVSMQVGEVASWLDSLPVAGRSA